MKIAISGANGRMGRTLVEATLNDKSGRYELGAALEREGSPRIGHDAGEQMGQQTGVIISSDPQSIIGCDVLIDYTRPDCTLGLLEIFRKNGIRHVIGTTGFSDEGRAAIAAAGADIAVLLTPNSMVGVNAVFKLLEVAGRLLTGYDTEIVEMHHRNKVDAPSGTALEMGRVIARARGTTLEECAEFARNGHTGVRPYGTIGFAALRGGDVVGDHTVVFAGPGERIEISHKSASRVGYANGALMAASFLMEHDKGFYSMADVLGIE